MKVFMKQKVRATDVLKVVGNRWFAAAATGVGLAVAFSGVWPLPLASFAVAPLAWCCRGAGALRGALLGALAAAVFGSTTSTWIPEAVHALGSSQWEGVIAQALVVLWVECPRFALLGAVLGATHRWAVGVRAATAATVAFASEWVISTAWWGVPWNLFGCTQSSALGVAQLAVVGGVPAISWLLVALGTALGDLMARRRFAGRCVLAFASAWAALFLLGLPVAQALRPDAEGQVSTLLFVQPDIPRGDRWGDPHQPLNLHRVRRFAAKILGEETAVDPHAIVLPENLLTTSIEQSPELGDGLQGWVDELGAPVLMGLVLDADPPSRSKYRSSVVWIAPERGVVGRIDKERAIPLFESARSLPGERLLGRLIGRAASWPRVQEASGQEPPLEGGPVSVAPVLCYEVLFPGIADRRRTPESLALVNLADDTWLQGEVVTQRLTRIARFRAIEQRLTTVRLAHGGLSAEIDPFGRITRTLPLDEYAAMRVELRPHPPPRLPEKVGLLGLPLSAFAGVWWVGSRLARREVNHDHP